MVEYTKNTVSITCYDSISSVVFVDELAPHEIQARLSKSNMWINNMQPLKGALVFNKTERGYEVDPTTVMPQHRIEIDRKISVQVSRQLRPFLKYREARNALQGVRAATGQVRMTRLSLDACLEHFANPEMWPVLYDDTRYVTDDVIRHEMTVYSDGVKKVPLPIGQRPTKSVYDNYAVFL